MLMGSSQFDQSWILLQMADSALPVGGFVASNGLEAMLQTGHTSSIEEFILESVNAIKYSQLVFLDEAMTACTNPSAFDDLIAVDQKYQAFIGSNHVNQRASTAQGIAYLSLIDRSFPSKSQSSNNIASQFKLSCRQGKAYGHLPICFAITCYSLEVDGETARFLYLFLQVRAVISAAVRMSMIGPYRGQEILYQARHIVKEALENNDLSGGGRITKDPVQTNPILDIIQGSHDRLYTRIFNS